MIATWSCPHEDEIRHASLSGRWTPALESHAAGCDACGDVRLVAAALVSPPFPAPASVEPRSVFAVARRVRRLHVESKISLIVTAAQAIALAAIVAVLLSFVNWTTIWPAWPVKPDADTWIYATAGLALAALFGVSRWLTQES
ncbi:MAG TPA: hypothetical protein VLT86_19605 [Vicinamibacterales bacterium]|nr:hypothetical protein [Vicinamibacterales bacterium]